MKPSKYSFLLADAMCCYKIFSLLLSLRYIFVLVVVSIYFCSVDAFMSGSVILYVLQNILKTDLPQSFRGLVVHFKTIFWSLVYRCYLWEDSHIKVEPNFGKLLF